LIVKRDPEITETNKPPMMAVTKPMMGGKSEALAIPKLRGIANRKTTKPAVASAAKFSFNPAQPSLGEVFFELICISCIVFGNLSQMN
jgi:hypothetical protein